MITLRIATTDSFGAHVMRALDPLRAQHPELTIQLLTANATIDLRMREADLAVRMFRDDDEALASLKLGSLGWSLYASKKYLASHPAGPGLLDGHRVIGYADSLTHAMAGAAWIAGHAPPGAVRMQCAGPGAALKLALTDLGVCVIPCYMAEGAPLERLTNEVIATTEVYAVFLSERREEPFLAAAIDALFEGFERENASLSGSAP